MTKFDKSRSLIERAAAELRNADLPSLDHLVGGDSSKRGAPRSGSRAGSRESGPGAGWPAPSAEPLLPWSEPARAIAPPAGAARETRAAGAAGGPPPVSVATLEEAGMMSLQRRRDGIGEEFRVVRQQILDRMEASAGPVLPGAAVFLPRVVAVTSPKRGEGKSFASLNLAAILAEGGDRPVLLVDGDIGDASLTRKFALEQREGLLDLGLSPVQLAPALMVPTKVDNLSFLPIGGGGDADARMAASARYPIRTIAEGLARSLADTIIVIDMPSCLTSSDPVELAPIVSQIVLVVAAGRTRRRDVEAALDRLDPCTNVNLLLNRAAPRDSGPFRALF